MTGPFTLQWTDAATEQYNELRDRAEASLKARERSKKAKAARAEGLFKQIHKTLEHLKANPRHPGLQTHVYRSLPNPIDPDGKVVEAYAQNKTPGAYRVFWCYGPENDEITIIAITEHP